MQGRGKQISIAANQHATTEELLEMVFSVWSVLRLYSEAQREKLGVGGWSQQLSLEYGVALLAAVTQQQLGTTE
jgi:hypothetical protein